VKFVATKKGLTTNFFSPLSLVAVFGSGIRDPRSVIRDPEWVNIRIRDKHHGSATLLLGKKKQVTGSFLINVGD
jgi:single-stranded DNA-specific DHH superfamily exonuclease